MQLILSGETTICYYTSDDPGKAEAESLKI